MAENSRQEGSELLLQVGLSGRFVPLQGVTDSMTILEVKHRARDKVARLLGKEFLSAELMSLLPGFGEFGDFFKNPPTPLWRWRRAYWGANSYTKCSITFVNIAVAISALAGGAQKRFRTETRIRWCFRHFSRIFGCLSARGYWNWILGHFGSFPAMEKRPKMKKTLYIARFCKHWKHCKNKCFGLTL